MTLIPFAKGHGTLNDFVIVEGQELSPAEIAWLCDRRAGVGGDGLLNVVRGSAVPEWDGDPEVWFMDYRNADGSVAQMCGNGLRVFVAYLREAGLVPRSAVSVPVGTRAGLLHGWYVGDQVRVLAGRPRVAQDPVLVRCGQTELEAWPVDVGNPHAVVLLPEDTRLASVDLREPPACEPASAFPEGVNVEVVQVLAPGSAQMRVYERGVGETFSCGTGTVAAAAASAAVTGVATSAGSGLGSWQVSVPGGRVTVDLTADGAYLTGPAAIVYRGTIELG